MSSDQPIVSLSTCWCSRGYTDGYQLCADMAGLGFDWIELSHGVPITLAEGILKAVEAGVVRISSVHNFCPLPPGVSQPAPNLFQPTGPKQLERDMWFRHSSNTLDFAARVGAKRVIMHSGSCWFFLGPPDRKLEAYGANIPASERTADPKYNQLRDRAMKRIRRKARKTMARLIESMSRLVPLAQERGVQLCLENREDLKELPLDDQWPAYLRALPDPTGETVKYWHDTGHAQLKALMGVATPEGLLAENAERLSGFHLHDVSADGHDHQPLGTGTVDFALIRSYIRPGHALILELSPRLDKEAILASHRFLKERLLPG
ncbi:MAG: sugar phosphate isomerase/epimerase family protein [Opitutales bacterium]